MDIPVGSILSAAGRIWEAFHDRPASTPVFRLAHYRDPGPGVVTTHIGKYVEIEVHSVGRQPMLVRSIDIELSDGRMVPLKISPRQKPVARPGYIEVNIKLDRLIAAMRDGLNPGAAEVKSGPPSDELPAEN